MLRPAEHQQLLVKWNQTARVYEDDRCLHELVEARVEEAPEAEAVVFEDDAELTYRELNARANMVAHHLRSLGVGPDTLVGLCLERGPEMIVGLLGIIKAGGAYLPLDPAYPRDRLAFMLADSSAPVLLTQEHLLTELPEHDGTCVCVDRDWE